MWFSTSWALPASCLLVDLPARGSWCRSDSPVGLIRSSPAERRGSSQCCRGLVRSRPAPSGRYTRRRCDAKGPGDGGRRRHPQRQRQRGNREAIRVLLSTREGAVSAYRQALNQLYALVVSAPEPIRERLIRLKGEHLVTACGALRSAAGDIETSVTVRVLRQVARRTRNLQAEAAEHQALLEKLVAEAAPSLLAQPGVGAITAAQLLVSWSHAGRIRNQNAFAALAGVAPVPASSGRVIRHRLNRQGDRRLNRALHVVAVCRSSFHAPTKAYIARRTTEGKSPREIRRCLKRYLARRFFRLLQRLDNL